MTNSPKRNAYIIVMSAALPFVFFLVIFAMSTGEASPLPNMKPAPPAERLYIPDNCWTGGEGHPLPDHVIYDNKLYGPHMTQRALDSLFGDGKLDTSKINAFCSVEFDRAG